MRLNIDSLNVNMNLGEIEAIYFMLKKEKEIARVHRQKIAKGSDGRWRTYVYANGKRKQVARSTKEGVIDYLYSFYFKKEEKTFENLFKEFLTYKKVFVSDNTIVKNEWCYRRYFEGTKLSSMAITDITTEDIGSFLVNGIKTFELSRRAYEELFWVTKSALRYARNKRYISENPIDFIEVKELFKYCKKKRVNPRDRIISDDEMASIMAIISKRQEKQPTHMAGYAVRLAALTGMRVGELAALRWDRVDFNARVILIDQAEVLSARKRTYYIEGTKNDKVRYIPITDEIEDLLLTVRAVEEQYGYLTDYVFSDSGGRVNKDTIGRYSSRVSKAAGCSNSKSIHAYRRTINSVMKENGVSTAMAASMLGHTEDVNDTNYTYDVTDMDQKRAALAAATKRNQSVISK